MQVRAFRCGDEMALHAVFLSAIHLIAAADYTPEHINAWAPRSLDPDVWIKRMQGIRPFVVEHDGELLAYADLQDTGYIDHFFVSGNHGRQGLGRMLMEHIHQAAHSRGIGTLTSDVSRTAQPFFMHFGFSIVEQRALVSRGVSIPNAFMRKTGLDAGTAA
jgi:putative acetyltransferase